MHYAGYKNNHDDDLSPSTATVPRSSVDTYASTEDEDDDLDEEGESPPHGRMVVEQTSDDTATHGTGAVGDIADALDDTSLPERDQIRSQEGSDGHETATTNAGHHPTEYHDTFALGKTTY